jgi:hypothetical protein
LPVRSRAYIVHFEIAVHQQKKILSLFSVNVKFRQPLSSISIENIMPRSEWICNTCGKGFEIKGKRDNHREREHREKAMIDIGDRRAERSENGKFICKYGRDYLLAPSLRRHQKNCKSEVLSKEITEDEGVYQISVNADVKS